MAVLASDLIEATRSLLDSGSRPEMNRLNGSLTSSVTTVTLEFALKGVREGAVIAVDLEHMLVWSATGQVATVQRGYNGTTATTHADDSLVFVNPRWSAFTILRAINDEIASYSSPRWGLFQMKTVDLTYVAAQNGYDLTLVTDLIDVYSIESTGYTTGDLEPIRNWRLVRNQSAAVFASGFGLVLYEGANPGRNIRVVYKAPFAALTGLTSDAQTVAGLPASANDIPPLGAAARLVVGREIKRAFTESQPEPRAAAEVPPGANRQAAGGLLQIRDDRLREESARLAQRYPTLAKVS